MGGKNGVAPAVPEDELAATFLERAQLRIGRVKKRAEEMRVLLPRAEIVLGVVPLGIIEYKVLEELGAQRERHTGEPLFFDQRRRQWAGDPIEPAAGNALGPQRNARVN